MKILITGTAGFIGFHLAKFMLERGDEVVGIDNINDYYDVGLKYARLRETGISEANIAYSKPVRSTLYPNYLFVKIDITDHLELDKLFNRAEFDVVCNLAAQAGVRYSLTNPKVYLESNITGFLHVLECCRKYKIKHLVYASSSSVYGLNQKMPFAVKSKADKPASFYAASKKSNELMAHAYSHLFKLPVTGLRFFTVYGPWGRPDMALYLFTQAILENKVIEIYNNGLMKRDFTYVDDIVDGLVRAIDQPPVDNTAVPYRLFNIGKGEPVSLMDFITEIEKSTGLIALRTYLPLQNGDIAETWADIKRIKKVLNYDPKISVEEGVKNFVAWYKGYYKSANYETTFSAGFSQSN